MTGPATVRWLLAASLGSCHRYLRHAAVFVTGAVR